MALKTQIFQFGPFRLDPLDHLLLRDGKRLPLPPKAFDTLLYLVKNSGRLVTREEIIKAVWPGRFVEDGSLSVNVSLLRKTLGAMLDGEPYIETVPTKGYRFQSPVASADQDESSEVEFASLETTHISGAQPASAIRTRALASKLWIVVTLGLLFGTALVTAWKSYWSIKASHETGSFRSMKISRIIPRPDIVDAALSPDGRYLAHFLNEDQGQSLWIRQLGTSGDIRILPPETGEHLALTFSPAGNYLYYVRALDNGSRILYRMPMPGGESARVVSGVTGPISFSPDGKQFAFIQMDPAHWEARLMVANEDGSGLRRIAVRTRPRYFSSNGLAWLPDGRSIACFAGNAADYTGPAFHVVQVHLADGTEKAITSQGWAWAGSIVTSPSSNSLLVAASEQAENALQVWIVSLPSGIVSRVTNDLSNYAKLSLTSDGKTLAAVETDTTADLWTAPSADIDHAAPIFAASIHGFKDITWTPDGQIVYTARAGDYFGTFVVDSERKRVRQIAPQLNQKVETAVTRDGRYMLAQSMGKIWRMNTDGTDPRQLTYASHDVHPTSSADSKSVIYCSFANWSPAIGGKPTLWRISINGGSPVQLTSLPTSLPQVSPDGEWIAAAYFPGEDPRFSEDKIAVLPFAGGEPVKIFNRGASSNGAVYWAPNGKALDYVVVVNGAGNIWRQPLNGTPPEPLTHFKADRIFDFAWAPDGHAIVMARGKAASDVVLIKNSD